MQIGQTGSTTPFTPIVCPLCLLNPYPFLPKSICFLLPNLVDHARVHLPRVSSAFNKNHLRARPPSKPGSAHQRATATVREPPQLHFEPSAPSLAALKQKIELLQSFQGQGIEPVVQTSPARAKGRV